MKIIKESKMSKRARVCTRLAWGIFAVVLLLPLLLRAFGAEQILIPVCYYYAIMAVVLTVLLVLYGKSPLRIEVSDECLTIVRRWGRTELKLEEIREVCAYDEKTELLGLRLLGAEGFYGYVGWFMSHTRGIYEACATNIAEAFWVEMCGGKAYLLSCTDRDEVMAATGAAKGE